MSERYRPFHCGSQYNDWEDSNCCRCAKYSEDASKCDLMMSLAVACFDDGTIDETTARRIGYLTPDGTTRHLAYVWECAERESPSQAIAEPTAASLTVRDLEAVGQLTMFAVEAS